MIITMETAFLFSALCSMLGLIFMTLFAYNKKYKDLCAKCFIAFYIFEILLCLMIMFREELGTFISIIISNVIGIIAILLLYRGICKVINQKDDRIFSYIIISSFIALFLLFTYVYNSVLFRILIINVYLIIIVLKIIITLQKTKKHISFFDELMSLLLSIYLLVFVARILFNIIFRENNNDFLSYTLDPIFILLIGVFNLMFLTGVLSLYNNDFVARLTESDRKHVSLISNLPGFAYRCLNDDFWTMKYVSNQFEIITGYKTSDIIGNTTISYEDLILKKSKKAVRDDWNKAVKAHQPFIGEYQITKKDGEIIWVWEQGIPIYETNGNCEYLEGFIMDITERKNLEDYLKTLSYCDTLTQLHNRRHIERKIKEIEKAGKYPISIIMGDINGLKFVNDTFGHGFGDQVLVYVANSILDVINNKDLVSRISGDEYVIILENCNEEKANNLISLIQDEVFNNNPFDFEVSISLGFATTYNNKHSLVEIEKFAEDNMYKHKIYAKPSNQRKTIDAVLKTLNEKDPLSEQHSKNVSNYARKLATIAGYKTHNIEKVETAALLHDVGKIIISKDILASKNRLTDEEYEEIKKHPEIGYRILNSVPELTEIAEIILYHHERIDGKGYPKGILGERIPEISKIISICDAFDAMINERFYRNPVSIEEAIEELEKNKGTQFDPKLTELFINNIDKIINK